MATWSKLHTARMCAQVSALRTDADKLKARLKTEKKERETLAELVGVNWWRWSFTCSPCWP